ncbi:polygalacturonase-like [Canna indica]|uniref:Polygalacturonase-like n=1 Tax=Canna indica TaxID=4628 RepID=A0AAQ3Q845_9LILI|nr:polygalacturonase-like [Canna indica]
MSQSFAVLHALLTLLCLSTMAMLAYNVQDFGAKPDGRTDAAKPFLAAWAAACGASKPATIIVPAGRFLVSHALFKGPCKNKALKMFIQRTCWLPLATTTPPFGLRSSTWKGCPCTAGRWTGMGRPFGSARRPDEATLLAPRDHLRNDVEPAEDFSIRILCATVRIGMVIGKGGANVRQLEQHTCARIQVEDTASEA